MSSPDMSHSARRKRGAEGQGSSDSESSQTDESGHEDDEGEEELQSFTTDRHVGKRPRVGDNPAAYTLEEMKYSLNGALEEETRGGSSTNPEKMFGGAARGADSDMDSAAEEAAPRALYVENAAPKPLVARVDGRRPSAPTPLSQPPQGQGHG